VKRLTRPGKRAARRLLVALAGGAIVALGLLLVVTPGPALLVIPAGLGILALEFETPRRWRQRSARWIRERRARMFPSS
jgi:tellurite resistance protein TerC